MKKITISLYKYLDNLCEVSKINCFVNKKINKFFLFIEQLCVAIKFYLNIQST